MGIRFDRDSRRTTNGPMFFFSILKDETFAEEIRNAFLSGLSFYAYRFPNDHMLCYGSSEGFVEGLGTPGFIIGMFSPEKPYITIPYHPIPHYPASLGSLYYMPEKSSTFEEYSEEVNDIIQSIMADEGTKVVAARVIVENTSFDIAEKFFELCQNFPEAFVFCFGTPVTGCWIGASPELLLKNTNGVFQTMALAGTRSFRSEGEWDDKNIEEQKIVTEYIAKNFRQNGLVPEIGETYTKQAGSIEHICTEIRGLMDKESGMRENSELEKLLRDLSPTPALCGSPKEFALKKIHDLEKFDRGCYGGFCGPFHSLNDFHLQVAIRCASVSENRYCVYVGGGITAKSDVSKEWEETCLKSSFFQ